MFVDLMLSKHKNNGAVVRRFLLVLGTPFEEHQLLGAPFDEHQLLGAPFDEHQLRGAAGVYWASRYFLSIQ